MLLCAPQGSTAACSCDKGGVSLRQPAMCSPIGLRKRADTCSFFTAVNLEVASAVFSFSFIGCATTAITAAHGGKRRAARTSFITKALIADVPVLTNPAPSLVEEARKKRAEQYRLLLFGELTLSFTDTDGDHLLIQKDGLVINEYVNGRLDVRNMKYFQIDESKRTYRDSQGTGAFRPDEDVQELVRKRDLIFIEHGFVVRALMAVCGLKDNDASQVAMTALSNGIAVVGTYTFEVAEAYCEGLKSKGLSADITPVSDNTE